MYKWTGQKLQNTQAGTFGGGRHLSGYKQTFLGKGGEDLFLLKAG